MTAAATLADALAAELRAHPPELGAEVVVLVPSEGFGRWLAMALAQRLGVCAGLQFATPSRHFARWDRDASWSILAALPAVDGLPLASEAGPQRWAFAAQVAAMFERYAAYRPDWLAEWATDGGGWQGALLRAADPTRREPAPARLYLAGATPAPGHPLPPETPRFALAPRVGPTPRVLAASGDLRQVEALRDEVLEWLSTSGRAPRDVLIITPRIERFGPLVQAAFAAPPHPLPVDLADSPLSVQNPAAGAFLAALDLLPGRFPASEVLALLARPPVAARFRVADPAVARLWAERAHIRWGLDAAHVKTRGVDASGNTWRAGLDRLLLGQAVGDADDLVLGICPDEGIEGAEDRRALGGLAALAEALGELARTLAEPRAPADWATVLSAWVDRLVDVPDDPGAAQTVRAGIQEALGRAGPAIDLDVVRHVLRQAFARGDPGRRFLAGGVTVCGPATGRHVPAGLVCVLGVDDEDDDPRPGFDRMGADRRAGDPDPRRAQFELIADARAAARDACVVTYSQRNPDDGRPRPVPAALRAIVGTSTPTVAPLQPFAPAAFADPPSGVGPALLAGARAATRAPAAPPPFAGAPLPDAPIDALDLEALIKFWGSPVKGWFRALGVWLSEPAEAPSDSPPVALDGLQRWKISGALLDAVLAGAPLGPDAPVVRRLLASGELPPGLAGEACVRDLAPTAERVGREALSAGYAARRAQPVELTLDTVRLSGRIAGLCGDSVVVAHPSKTRAKHLLPHWIAHLALAASGWRGRTLVIGSGGRQVLGPVDEAAARAHLTSLVAWYRAGLTSPLPFDPPTSGAYAQARALRRRDHAQACAAAARDWGRFGLDPHLAQAFGPEPPFAATAAGLGFADLALGVFAPLWSAWSRG